MSSRLFEQVFYIRPDRKHTDVLISTWYLAALAATALLQDFVAVQHLQPPKWYKKWFQMTFPDAEEVKKLCAVRAGQC